MLRHVLLLSISCLLFSSCSRSDSSDLAKPNNTAEAAPVATRPHRRRLRRPPLNQPPWLRALNRSGLRQKRRHRYLQRHRLR